MPSEATSEATKRRSGEPVLPKHACAPTRAVALLEDHDLVPLDGETNGDGETAESAADHDHPHAATLAARSCGGKRAGYAESQRRASSRARTKPTTVDPSSTASSGQSAAIGASRHSTFSYPSTAHALNVSNPTRCIASGIR